MALKLRHSLGESDMQAGDDSVQRFALDRWCSIQRACSLNADHHGRDLE